MDEKAIQEVADEIAKVLAKHQMVIARGLFQDELGLVIRPREKGESVQEFSAFGRNVYSKGRDLDPLHSHEREAYRAWHDYFLIQQQELMQLKSLADVVRASNVELRTHASYYDGPLTGLCYHDNRWAFYAVIEQYTGGLTPRVFCLWYLDSNQTKMAQDFYQQLQNSGWSHLAYAETTGKRGEYTGGDYPAKDLRDELFGPLNKMRGWISENFGTDLQNVEAKHPEVGPSSPRPDRWFTSADKGMGQDRQGELEYFLELSLDNLVEQWDCGYNITFPEAG